MGIRSYQTGLSPTTTNSTFKRGKIKSLYFIIYIFHDPNKNFQTKYSPQGVGRIFFLGLTTFQDKRNIQNITFYFRGAVGSRMCLSCRPTLICPSISMSNNITYKNNPNNKFLFMTCLQTTTRLNHSISMHIYIGDTITFI